MVAVGPGGRQVADARRVPMSLEGMRKCLADGYPIVFGLKLTAAFFSPSANGFVPTPVAALSLAAAAAGCSLIGRSSC